MSRIFERSEMVSQSQVESLRIERNKPSTSRVSSVVRTVNTSVRNQNLTVVSSPHVNAENFEGKKSTVVSAVFLDYLVQNFIWQPGSKSLNTERSDKGNMIKDIKGTNSRGFDLQVGLLEG